MFFKYMLLILLVSATLSKSNYSYALCIISYTNTQGSINLNEGGKCVTEINKPPSTLSSNFLSIRYSIANVFHNSIIDIEHEGKTIEIEDPAPLPGERVPSPSINPVDNTDPSRVPSPVIFSDLGGESSPSGGIIGVITDFIGSIFNNGSATNSATAGQQSSDAGSNMCPSNVGIDKTITLGSEYQTWFSRNHPGSTPYVVEIIVPDNYEELADKDYNINFAPYSGPGGREYLISKNACDTGSYVKSYGRNVVYFTVDKNKTLSDGEYLLTPGKWYLNLRSISVNGVSICQDYQTCTMNMQYHP